MDLSDGQSRSTHYRTIRRTSPGFETNRLTANGIARSRYNKTISRSRSRSRDRIVQYAQSRRDEKLSEKERRRASASRYYSESSQDESNLPNERGRKSRAQQKPNAPLIKQTISDDRTEKSQVQSRLLRTVFRSETGAAADDVTDDVPGYVPNAVLDNVQAPRPLSPSDDDEDIDVHLRRRRNDNSLEHEMPHVSRAATYIEKNRHALVAPTPPLSNSTRGMPRYSRQTKPPQSYNEEQDHNADSIGLALDVLSGALGLSHHSSLTLDDLAPLARQLKSQDHPIEFRCVVIHRVFSLGKIRMYLDRPQWVAGAESSRDALMGELPIHNIDQYLFKHRDICCIAYRNYQYSPAQNKTSKTSHTIDDNHSTAPLNTFETFMEGMTDNAGGSSGGQNIDLSAAPDHSHETLEPVTQPLEDAFEYFLKYYSFEPENDFTPSALALTAPYTLVYHNRDNLDKFVKSLDFTSRHQFNAMLDYILSQYQSEYELVDKMVSQGKIRHAHIEYLFKPGEVIVENTKQAIRGYMSKGWLIENKADGSNSKEKPRIFSLQCWTWEFDGKFARKQVPLKLVQLPRPATTELSIETLSLLPLKYASKDVEAQLRQRGEWIWKCRIRSLVTYQEDPSTATSDSSKDQQYRERYMIDMMMYRELHQGSGKGQNSSTTANKSFTDIDELQEVLKQDTPPDNDFVYLTPATIKGYNFKTKRWLELQVDQIREISWDKEAFNSLVIKEKTKRLIRAFISNHIEAERSTDLISGKGNGLILLLHGGPGTGKTLTAESVAEIAERPLYPVTCGDIGTEPEAVENYLESVLHIGKTWGCVVLLDEADVFLEQRSLEDLRRNALVSVFLRVLEYYEGILILTSNRVGTFDEAFKSRIQLAIHYQNLDLPKRTKIWGNFIDRLEKLEEEGVDFADLRDNIDKLAMNQMNGREIRNAITTARQYIRWERQQPNQEHLKLDYAVMNDIIETAGEFNQYILDVKGGMSNDEIAAEDGLRVAVAE